MGGGGQVIEYVEYGHMSYVHIGARLWAILLNINKLSATMISHDGPDHVFDALPLLLYSRVNVEIQRGAHV